MSDAGCVQVSLGFESGSPEVLKLFDKKFSPDDIRRIAAMFARQGVKRTGFLLLGGPGETRETVEESLSFVDSLHLDVLKLTVGTRIYPGTPLAKRAVKEGMIAAEDDLLYPRFYMRTELEDWLPGYLNQWRSTRTYPIY